MSAAPITSLPSLPLRHLRRGKVREVYEVDADRLLIIATDRVSAFDVVMNEPVPRKGVVLTQLTAWWLRHFERDVRHHMISSDVAQIIDAVPSLDPYRAELNGRAMLCKRTVVFPIECVVRGYIAGSAWKEYRERGTLAGEPLPKGLRESSRLEVPIFSPATKAETGHDENITTAEVARAIGGAAASELERLTLRIYSLARDIVEPRGIIIADTKFEFGRDAAGQTTLIDEVLTPDSSRFWLASTYEPGRPQASYDKQPLRDWLDGERRAGRWNGEYPPPPLPDRVVSDTATRYANAFRLITGHELNEVVPE